MESLKGYMSTNTQSKVSCSANQEYIYMCIWSLYILLCPTDSICDHTPSGRYLFISEGVFLHAPLAFESQKWKKSSRLISPCCSYSLSLALSLSLSLALSRSLSLSLYLSHILSVISLSPTLSLSPSFIPSLSLVVNWIEWIVPIVWSTPWSTITAVPWRTGIISDCIPEYNKDFRNTRFSFKILPS